MIEDTVDTRTHRRASVGHRASELLDEYYDKTGPFLEKHLPVALGPLDRCSEVLEDALEVRSELNVGFVGESQVGKSTLLNALLGAHAVPTGGVGPLTAKPIHIKRSESQSFTARYHDRKQLNQTRFAAEKHLARKPGESTAAEELDPDLETSQLALAVDGPPQEGEASQVGAILGIGDELLGAVRVMFGVDGDEGPDNALAVDALRLALGQKPAGDDGRLRGLSARIDEVRALIGTEHRYEEEGLGAERFRDLLRSHAAGWRSPLVHELDVLLRADVLKSVNFVDLPGVGTINDPAQEETKRFVGVGDALAIVVRNNGITEAVVQLLERSEFLTRWIWSGDLEHPPIHVVIIVTHIDNVAKDRHREERTRARESGGVVRSRDEVFLEVATEMKVKILTQMRSQLLGSPAFLDLDESESDRRREVVDALCDGLEVHCVSAPDAIELECGDEDEAYLKDMHSTGIPILREAFRAMSQARVAEREKRITHCFSGFSDLLQSQVERAARSYEEVREVSLLARFREVAEPILPSLRERMQGVHGRCQARLAEGIPGAIRQLCDRAETVGLKKLSGLRKHAEGLHYQSLNAALRRSGRWDNQGVDYPGLLTRTIVEAVANGWKKSVVEPVRQTLDELAIEDADLSNTLVEAARSVDESLARAAGVEAYLAGMQAAADSVAGWGDAKLEALRESAREKLSPAVLGPIAAHCELAEREGRNRGAGAKLRIIEVLDEGGQAAIEEASNVADGVLQDLYQAMLGKVNEKFISKYGDPLRDVYGAIMSDGSVRKEEELAALRAEAVQFLRDFQGVHGVAASR